MDCTINKEFLPIKALYFLFMAGFACMIPYLPVYFVYLGLDVWQIGIMRGMEPFLVFLLSPVWGAIADKFGKHKPALIVALVGSGVFYFSLIFVPFISRHFTGTELMNVTVSGDQLQGCSLMRTLTLPSLHRGESSDEACVELCDGALNSSYPLSGNDETYLCTADGYSWECHLCDLSGEDNRVGHVDHHGDSFASSKKAVLTMAICDSELHYSFYSSNSTLDNFVDCYSMASCECHVTADIPTATSIRVTFALSFLLVALSVSFNCNILAFLDAVVMQMLGAENRKDYGKHRMWGAVGWGIMAFLSGFAIDTFTSITGSSGTRYEPLFVMLLISIALSVVVAITLKYPKHEKPDAMHQDLFLLAKQPEILMFLFVITVEGISFGMCFSYVMIFLTRELQASHTLMGLSILVTTMAEIPILFTSGKIIKAIGYQGVVYATLAAYALRYAGYGVISNPWLVLPIQVLHGITFGLGWPGFTHFAITNAPKGMAATLQAIMLGMYIGVGTAIGNLFGGFIYDAIGARKLFFLNVGLLIFTALIFFIVNHFVIKKKSDGAAAAAAYGNDTKGGDDGNALEVKETLNGHTKEPLDGEPHHPEGQTMLGKSDVEVVVDKF